VILLVCANAYALTKNDGSELNQPPPPAAVGLVKRAVILAESDKPLAAIAALRKAMALAPNYLQAHIEYRNVKANFLNRQDEVDAEYQALIKRFPRNPVYLMAVNYRPNGPFWRENLQRVVELAPKWAWGHYAKALLIKGTDPEKAVVEIKHCLEKNPNALPAYDTLIELQETRLHEIDEAILTAEQLARQIDIRATLRLEQLWRLRLVREKQSAEAKAALASELAKLESSREVDTLLAIRSAYLHLLKESERARLVEKKIVALDPSWTPQRGWIYNLIRRNQSQVPRHMALVNRQIALAEKVADAFGDTNLSREDRIVRLKELLDEQPNVAVRRIIYEDIFQLAVRSGRANETRMYGNRLHLIDPDDSVLLSRMALVLADRQVHLKEAIAFARQAERLTSEFHLAPRPANTSQLLIDSFFPEKKQREQYKVNRALALDALGWTLTRVGRPAEAEHRLRQANEIEKSEDRLFHLARTLQMLGRNDEAALFETESDTFLVNRLKKTFTNEPLEDLQLESIDGRRLKLADLKGKVVLIDFWATWCWPCVQEMPALKKLRAKYQQKDFEIIAVSIDENGSKVQPFAKVNGLDFFVSHSPTIGERFKASPIPTTLFIDKLGHLRFRKVGFEEGDEREIEIVINELLK
jgi:thiol-disulfide isomerase/thioredoxin